MKHHSVHSQLVRTSYGEQFPAVPPSMNQPQEPQMGGSYSLYFEAPSSAVTSQPHTGLSLDDVTEYINQVVYHNAEGVTKVTIVSEDDNDDANNPPAGGAGAYPEELESQPPSMTDAYAPALEQEQAQRTI